MRAAIIGLTSILLPGCNPAASDEKGYVPIDAISNAAAKKATDAWLDCLVYGIKQVDDANEPAATVADAAMAGCRRAETNLADTLFEAMKSQGDPREVRAVADDIVNTTRTRMREHAVRLVMSKHADERKE